MKSPRPAPKKPLPPALVKNLWKPGQSGNPGGIGGPVKEAMRLAREATPEAMRTLIELLKDEDPKVRAVAANAILDRSMGKPKDQPPEDPRADQNTLELKAALKLATNEELDILGRWFARINAQETAMSGAGRD